MDFVYRKKCEIRSSSSLLLLWLLCVIIINNIIPSCGFKLKKSALFPRFERQKKLWDENTFDTLNKNGVRRRRRRRQRLQVRAPLQHEPRTMRLRRQQHGLPRGQRIPQLRDRPLLQLWGWGASRPLPFVTVAGVSVRGPRSLSGWLLLPEPSHDLKNFTVNAVSQNWAALITQFKQIRVSWYKVSLRQRTKLRLFLWQLQTSPTSMKQEKVGFIGRYILKSIGRKAERN